MKKKISYTFLLFASLANGASIDLSQGWNLIGLDGAFTASSLSANSGISQATSGGVTAGNGLTYIRSAYSDGVSMPGQGYWINVDSSNESLTYTAASIDFVFMKSGWNLVNLPTGFNASQFGDYPSVTQATSGGVTAGSGLTYIKNAYSDGMAINGQGYWVYATSNVLLGTSSTVSTKFPSISSTATLSGKSLIVIDSDVKPSLITFENDFQYKIVSIDNFNINKLNSDLNNTLLTSEIGALPSTGECGTWAYSTTNNVKMTAVDDNNDTLPTVNASYTVSDGNFTVSTKPYTILWYGDAIKIDTGFTCASNSYFPPMLP